MSNREPLRVRDTTFDWGTRTYLMAIVNVTPDSFSGDGIEDAQLAVASAIGQWERGADILDIGGESTRPGHTLLDVEEELARVLPVIRGVRSALPNAPISIDTYKPAVAKAACAAGADIINCVWGAPDDMLAVAVECATPFVAMHNQHGTRYDGHVMDDVVAALRDAAQRGRSCGVPMIVDPGIGFGKTADQNIAVLSELRRLAQLGFPTLLGTSRKSTLGKLTGREPAERTFGTAATTALAIAAGIDIVRVHDVAETRDVIAVSDAIERGWRPATWTA